MIKTCTRVKSYNKAITLQFNRLYFCRNKEPDNRKAVEAEEEEKKEEQKEITKRINCRV
jgi:hypothetical protein